MKTQILLRLPAITSEQGTLPSHLIMHTCAEFAQDAIAKHGAVDVSDDASEWARYDRSAEMDDMHG